MGASGLLICIREVRWCRPARVGQLFHALRPVCETVDAPVELLEHPRPCISLLYILDVHDPRIHKRVVRLHSRQIRQAGLHGKAIYVAREKRWWRLVVFAVVMCMLLMVVMMEEAVL